MRVFDSILSTLGGQTGLTLSMQLAEAVGGQGDGGAVAVYR